MSMDNNDLLLKVFSSIFEDFAFMFVEEASGEDIMGFEECIRAKIEFKSTGQNGCLEVVASRDFCHEAAENILGTDMGELPQDAGENALKELVNICCGYLLAEKFGTDEIFDLSLPETGPVSEKELDSMVSDLQHIPFLVDESPILVKFTVQS